MADDLAALRDELTWLDEQLLRFAARRTALAQRIGALKVASDLPTRDLARGEEAADEAREAASHLGLPAQLAEELVLALIRASLTVQEHHRVAARAGGEGRSALIIGGAGKMGRWMGRFLASSGWQVTMSDPLGEVPGYPSLDWQTADLSADLVVVATPLRATNAVLHGLAERRPLGVVFDLASLKSPLRTGLKALVDAGVRVCSVHPMFGPDTELLSGRHVIFVDLGEPRSLELARGLFEATMASRVTLGLDDHDRVVAQVLGLSHAMNIAFLAALAESGQAALELDRVSSTTFDAQLGVARAVVAENPDLYFDIQSLNDHGLPALDRLLTTLLRLRESVAELDETTFTAFMGLGRAWVEGRP